VNALVELALALIELAKAEFAEAKAGVARLGIAFGIVIAGAVVLILGVHHLLGALTLALIQPFGPAWAECLTGIVALLLAGVFLWLGSKTAKS
jgi:hypothetical protein